MKNDSKHGWCVETTIKGKTFSKSQEADAEAWEKQNSQQIAFILDN